MDFGTSFALAFVVAFAGQAIDVFMHFLMGVEVHLGYIAVKTLVIFFAIFLITKWIGRGHREGALGAILASVMFYIYYRFAEATLDRTVFKIDEDTLFIVIHAIAIWLPYFLIQKFLNLQAHAA